MGKSSATIQGDKALQKLLKKLPDKVTRKVTRQAINAAANPVLKAARANAPVDEGVLKTSLAKKVKTYTKSQSIVAIIGPRSKEAPHAHLVEEGTGERVQKTTGRRTGRVTATHFLQRALEENKASSAQTMKTKLGKGVEREALKMKGKK